MLLGFAAPYDDVTMITRIEIDGFKSFADFALDLEPFTVIAGVNGVGKSNLFDALRHLRRLVGRSPASGPSTLRSAFESDRGTLQDLFTRGPDGRWCERMRFSVDLLLPGTIMDLYGVEAELTHRRLRYQVEIAWVEGEPRLRFEQLSPIRRKEDDFLRKHPHLQATVPAAHGRSGSDFLSTEGDRVLVAQDQRGGRKHPIPLAATAGTALSSINDVTFRHAYAARKALTDLVFLHLEPEALRRPSSFAAPTRLETDGQGIASVLARLKRSHPHAFERISRDIALIVPGVVGIDVLDDAAKELHVLAVELADGTRLPAPLASDGTLRLVALATMVHDPDVTGTVVLEEPENGVYAGRIDELLGLLHAFVAAPPSDATQRQLLATTHSVPLVQAIRRADVTESLVFAYLKRVVRSGREAIRATTMAPVSPHAVQDELFSEAENQRRYVAFQEMERLLETDHTGAA
jgi:predicted ATPase